jgi:glycosyltransferase involved in cell wall biosynthesis
MNRIFVSGMAYDGGKSGISVYIDNVLRELAVNNKLDVVVLPDDRKKMPVHENIRYIEISPRLAKPVVNMLWHLFILPFKIKWADYDFVLLPAANRRALWFYRKFTIAVVHDLSQYHVKCKYDPFRMFYIKKILPHSVRKAPQVVAVSQSTANDLQKYWNISEDRITVNYNGYDKTRFCVASDFIPGDAGRKFGLTKDFILYISRIEHPGKNHLNLIKAYELLPDRIRDKYDLVLGGSFWAGSEPVKEYAEQSRVRNSIKFIGFVENSMLPDLFRDASMYIFPSLFEGFGLSLVEAMACGTPVACSKNSSLGEIAGNAALTFSPESPAEMTDAMNKILSDHELRFELECNGLNRAKSFDWKIHAEKLVELYEKRS